MKSFNPISDGPFSWYGFVYTYVVTNLFLRLVLFPISEWVYTEGWLSMMLAIVVFLIGMAAFIILQLQLTWSAVRVMVWELNQDRDNTNGE